ncbi:hypothetical protein [Sphingobium sp.]|uniref:hypothetical protein n=1 Tax=Sphingobium sp. TaxID=1912891 RepID=UPI0025DDFD38|nr:hypothetical protein [Sphingobium sp.]
MKIELRRINHNPKLSEETNAYSAEVWIDGERAFDARNQGQGGCDHYRQIGQWTEAEVNAWLKSNRPILPFQGLTLEHDLEVEVGDLLAHELEHRRLKRLMRTNLVTIERGQIFQYPLRKRPLDLVASAVTTTNSHIVIVNGGDDNVIRQALVILLDVS